PLPAWRGEGEGEGPRAGLTVRVPAAAVPVVVIAVPLPVARHPVMPAALADVMAAHPDIAVVPPFVVPALPRVAAANDHPFLARWRWRVGSTVDDDDRRLRRLCSERREAERRDRKPGHCSLPVSQRITHTIPVKHHRSRCRGMARLPQESE